MSRSRYKIYETQYAYFLTGTVVNWLPIFSNPHITQIILDSWSYLQQQQRMILFGYVIMENHLHFIALADDLSKEVGDFKSYTARRIIDWYKEHNNQFVLDQLAWYKEKHKSYRRPPGFNQLEAIKAEDMFISSQGNPEGLVVEARLC